MSLTEKIAPEALKFIFNEDLYMVGPASSERIDIEPSENIQSTDEVRVPDKKKIDSDFIVVLNKSLDAASASHELLQKILGAVNRSMDNVDIIIDPKSQNLKIDNMELVNGSLKLILCFGINPFELGLQSQQINKYQLGIVDSFPVIQADDLASIQNNIDAKKALWLNLKKAFGMN